MARWPTPSQPVPGPSLATPWSAQTAGLLRFAQGEGRGHGGLVGCKHAPLIPHDWVQVRVPAATFCFNDGFYDDGAPSGMRRPRARAVNSTDPAVKTFYK